MTDLLTRLALAGAAISFAAYFALRYARRIACVSDWLLRIPRSHLAAFLLFAAIATVCAQKRGIGIENGKLRMENGGVVAVGDSTVLHSQLYILHSVTTNDTYSYAMPTNGMRYEKWWWRGAYEDVFRLDLGDFRFPLGTNMCDHLWAYTWGMAGARLCDVSNRVVATGSPMSAVPGFSQFWNAPTDNGTCLLTWQDFALGRDTNTLVSAQLELCPSGDYIARSNLVERVYRRVNPDDWDDDGIPNDADPDPYVYDGDFFGMNQELPQGANANAYCWVDVVVSNANALVTFAGDAPSALPDPCFIAKAGETNRVTVLIGKTYNVTSPMPIVCVGKSSCEIDVCQNSPTEMYICWPVTIESVSMRSGSSFSMNVWPDCLGGGFTWTNVCCSLSQSGSVFTYSCGDSCICTGCAALGLYDYENYCLPACGGSCGCVAQPDVGDGGEEDNGPGVDVSFSRKVLFYEDEYYDEALGITVPAWSGENVVLMCSVRGGQYGGVFTLSLANMNKLNWIGGDALPVNDVIVPPNETRSWQSIYGFAVHSDSEDDVQATATFTENISGDVMTINDTMTVVMLRAVADANWPTNKLRRVFGVGEMASIYKTPSISTDAVATRGVCTNIRSRIEYRCPYDGGDDSVEVTANGSSHSMNFAIHEPSGYSVISVSSNLFATTGQSGGFRMIFACRLLPRYVSFYKNIEIVEVACVSSDPHGYYAQPSKSHLLDHGQHGAGTWNSVGQGNGISDIATMEINYPPWLGGGSFTWPIPNRWRKSGSAVDGKYFCNTDQRFELDADGTSRVRKFGRIGERMTNGVYRTWRQN